MTNALLRRATLGLISSALLLCTIAPASAQFNGPQPNGQFNGPQTTTPSTPANGTVVVTTDHDILFPKVHDQLLSVGDLLAIRIFGDNDYIPSARIANDGTVLLPLIGSVPLSGISLTQAELLVASRLKQAGMYVDPQVIITVTEGPNAVVTVSGEAHAVIPVNGSRRLYDIIAGAGGLPATASHVVTINRPGIAEPIVIDLGTDPLHSELANVPVFPGDTVVISRLGVVYMIGSFKTQGVINLSTYAPLTLTQATALSGGLAFDGKMSDLRIIRTIGDRRTVVKVDVHNVLYGRAPDPILQPNDIVFLPTSAVKVAIEQGGIGTLLGVASIAISFALR